MKAKKKGYEKNAAIAYLRKEHAKASCQDGLNCQNPLLHSLKFQHVTLKYCLVIGFIQKLITCKVNTHIYPSTHARYTLQEKLSSFPVHILSKNLSCTSFLLPKCSISIREGNGKFASTCTKAHIINYKKILCSLNQSLIWIFYGCPEHTFPRL